MRRILVDVTRSKAGSKRGGLFKRIELPQIMQPQNDEPIDLLALDEALTKLEQDHPEKAAIVKLRLYDGLSLEEAVSAAGVSPTVPLKSRGQEQADRSR